MCHRNGTGGEVLWRKGALVLGSCHDRRNRAAYTTIAHKYALPVATILSHHQSHGGENIMRSIALLVGVLAIGLSSGARADEPGLNQAWCGVAFGGARECVYPTLAKCEAFMRPISGDCVPRE
jgi:hypothetical protein